MSVELADFWENVLDSFSSFYFEIAYSSFTFWRAKHFRQNEHTPDLF